MARRVQGLDAEVAALDDVAVSERPVGAARQARALERVGEHRRVRVARAHGLEVRDVVAVMMGDEHVRDRQAMAVDGATIGSGGPPASIRTALPSGRSPTT